MRKNLLFIFALLFFSNAICQENKLLSFKCYDKTISFSESDLDGWYGTYRKNNKVLYNNQELAYREYIMFKSRVWDGQRKNEYISIDRLKYVGFTSVFESSYFLKNDSELYKRKLKESGDKQAFKRTMQVRHEIISGVADLVIYAIDK